MTGSTDATWDFDSPDQIDLWLDMLEDFFRESQSADEDGQFRAIEARQWRTLLEALKGSLEDLASGDATIDDVDSILQQVKDFDAPYLSELGEWNDYFDTILSDISDAEETYATNTGFADYANEVGEGVANTAKGLYDELKDKITGCVGSPIDCIKQIGTAILDAGGIPDECQDMGDPFFCTEKGPDEGGKACWKDCVNFNIPGLPIPDIPLPPGVVDVGTYRDFENAVKTVGKTIGDIIDGNESCGPDGDQECTVGQVLEDLGDWAREKWEDAIGGIDDATGQDVLDWLKGILGPATAGIIWAEIEEEVTNVLTPLDPETKDCTDGSGQVYATVGINEECPPVPCLEGEKDFGNGCEPVCEYDESIPASNPQCEAPLTETEEQCNAQGKVYDELNDQCKEECKNPEYVIGADGNCGPAEEDPKCDNGATNYPDCNECPSGQKLENNQCVEDINEPQPEGCEAVDCNSPRPSSTTFAGQTAFRQWNDCCGSTHCPDGSLQQEGFDCDGNPTTSCEEQGLVTDPQTEECLTQDAFCAKYPDAEGCVLGPQEGEPCDSTGDGQNDGTIVNGECVATPEEECTKPDGTPTGATPSSGCEQCPDGYTFDFDGICQPDGGTINCEEYNRETNEDGTCGGCLPGFQKDTTLPNEPCVAVFDGCPPGYELVNGECTPVQCPEGQAYCESTGQCEEPQDCPGGPEEGGSNSGGGGGGFGLNLDIAEIGISGDPELLGRQRFGQQDFLTPLFTGNQGGGADFPIARFLQGKGDIV